MEEEKQPGYVMPQGAGLYPPPPVEPVDVGMMCGFCKIGVKDSEMAQCIFLESTDCSHVYHVNCFTKLVKNQMIDYGVVKCGTPGCSKQI